MSEFSFAVLVRMALDARGFADTSRERAFFYGQLSRGRINNNELTFILACLGE